MKQYLTITLISLCAVSFACSAKPKVEADLQEKTVPAAETSLQDVTDANTALTEGNRLMDDNDTEKAIEAYKRAIELNPNLPEPYFKLGIAYALMEMQMEQEGRAAEAVDSKGKPFSEKQFNKAVDVYKKWLDKNPDDDIAHYNLGRTYNKLYKDEEASKEFKQAVKLKPEESEYQTELGGSLIRLAQYHEAVAALKKALEIDAGNERAISMLEDAEAGRQRLDYSPPKNANQAPANTARSSRGYNSNSPSTLNTAVRQADSNVKLPAKPTPSPNRTPRPN